MIANGRLARPRFGWLWLSACFGIVGVGLSGCGQGSAETYDPEMTAEVRPRSSHKNDMGDDAAIDAGTPTSSTDAAGTPSGSAPEPDATSTIVWEDDFGSTSLGRYARRGVQQIISDGHDGTAVRFPYNDSSYDNLVEFVFAEQHDVYFRYWYRTSPGADPTCGGQGGSGFKWFNESATMPNPFLQNISTAKRFDTTNDGQWHKYTLHVVITPDGHGYEQIWVDDLLILDNSAYHYDHNAIGIVAVQFPGTVVQWFTGCDFTIDVDDLVVWR